MRRRWGRRKWLPMEDPQPGSTIHTLIEPRDGDWYWEAWYVGPRGMRNPFMYYSGWYSASHPHPDTVAGQRNTHGEARAELAQATNAMRAAIAATTSEHNHRDALRHEDVIRP